MDIKKVAEMLHPLERRVLPYLNLKSVSEIMDKCGMDEVEVIRALQWLENKNIVNVNVGIKEIIHLGNHGEEYAKDGLPERRFLETLSDELTLDHVKERANLDSDEFSVSLGLLKKEKVIEFDKGKVRRTGRWNEYLKEIKKKEEFLKKLPLENKHIDSNILNELKKRRGIIEAKEEKIREIKITALGEKLRKIKLDNNLIESISSSLLENKSWKGRKFRAYDVKINVPKIYPGRKHFVNEAIEYARHIWLEMGFKEMNGPLLQTSFWNFDALFTAQDHPVRDLQDTFFINNPDKGKLPYKELVEKIRKVHESGWTTNSKGWGGKWSEEEAKRNVLRTHTTVLSARTIAALKKEELPAKFFAVGRCFRNETLDWSHLFEFNQTEGIVVDPNANFKHLLGYLKEFFTKMGFEKVRFRPAYFPYCEPNVEIEVYHPVHKKWIELGGAGIFRPEVVKPLLGFECPVLAWGPGFDRMIMDYYRINDIRELYKNDLKQIKESKVWLR